ncbi:MAG: endonuclease/exonuclease/phosphatase family protein [bacterium]|nr:endonuclease/exonuclease/phosphatase family protein [bacterium]
MKRYLKGSYLYLFMFASLVLVLQAHAVDDLRIMTYNLRYDNPGDSLDNWHFRKATIVSMVRFHQPQVFCTQEGLVHQLQYLDSNLTTYRRVGVGRDDGKEQGEFCAIFYDTTALELLALPGGKQPGKQTFGGTFWLSPTPDTISVGWDAVLPRIATYAMFHRKNTSTSFLVMNTHFDHIGVNARNESAQLLVQRSKQLCDSLGKILSQEIHQIVTGDFNSSPADFGYRVMTTSSNREQRAFYDSRVVTQQPPIGPEYTYYGFDPRADFHGERIDYIFVSNQIDVLRYATLTDYTSRASFPSDHLPVVVDVRFPVARK